MLTPFHSKVPTVWASFKTKNLRHINSTPMISIFFVLRHCPRRKERCRHSAYFLGCTPVDQQILPYQFVWAYLLFLTSFLVIDEKLWLSHLSTHVKPVSYSTGRFSCEIRYCGHWYIQYSTNRNINSNTPSKTKRKRSDSLKAVMKK